MDNWPRGSWFLGRFMLMYPSHVRGEFRWTIRARGSPTAAHIDASTKVQSGRRKRKTPGSAAVCEGRDVRPK